MYRYLLFFVMLPSALLFAAPSMPSKLVLTPTETTVHLSWQDNARHETGYKIYRDDVLIKILGKSSTFYTDRGLQPHTQYRYTVKATDDRPQSTMVISTKETFYKEEPLTFKLYNLAGGEKDWLGVFAKGATYDYEHLLAWTYTGGLKDGDITVDKIIQKDLNALPKGEYQIVSFYNDSYKPESVSYFSVDDAGAGNDVCTIGDNELAISIKKNNSGIKLTMQHNGENIIDVDESQLFKIFDTDNNIYQSKEGWKSIDIDCQKDIVKIKFTEENLNVLAQVKVVDGKSKWTYSIDVADTKSISHLDAPYLKFKKHNGEDYLFYPSKLGMLSKNPTSKSKPFKIEGSVYDKLTYPTGADMSMQYMAYYGADFGLYLGYHDPKASIKSYHAKGDNNTLAFYIETPIPNATINNNDFSISGEIEIDVFHGDWYDAAQIYKKWVFASAEYRPVKREAIQNTLSHISLWTYFTGDKAINDLKAFVEKFKGTRFGVVTNHWGNFGTDVCGDWDCGYPNYFPVREDISNAIADILRENENIYFMPYVNGRIYQIEGNDTQPDYNFLANHAIKINKNGDYDYSSYNHKEYKYVTMNPLSQAWQEKIGDISQRALNDLGAQGVYIDQVGRASVVMCEKDAKCHGDIHGGSQWRDGYKKMFDDIREKIADNVFIITEGNSDFIIDKVDGYNVLLSFVEKTIPAFQAVYGGKVHLRGVKNSTDSYNKNSFYAKFAQAFVRGVVAGGLNAYFANDLNAEESARQFITKLSKLRSQYSDYLALGSMQRVPKVEILKGVKEVSSEDWNPDDVIEPVTISSIQAGAYCHKDGGKMALFFVNANKNKNETVKFKFTVANNNCAGMAGHTEVVELKGLQSAVYTIENGRGELIVK